MLLIVPVENDNDAWSEEQLALLRRHARQRQRSLVRRVGMRRPLPMLADASSELARAT